ncbi:probable ribonuclease ZC3H12C [Trichonephila inaurata madagascariensis]|uniref:Probable ribonuclease ZC3H12C n=1 Tax=Trichonephila inaurata madagascariensis TaxID=2747483 RepID=A0A8X6YFT0_9ARAC|nr:probable ribonuclease ZC3H12C [Trichonephila inaurata madagascariensis]
MDNLFLSYEEQKLISKHKAHLESTYHVRIFLPDVVNTPTFEHDLIVANVQGEPEKINRLKKFIEKKMEARKRKLEPRSTVKNNVPVITLSDSSDSDSSDNVIFENQQKVKRKKQMKVLSKTPSNCSNNKNKLFVDLVTPVKSGNSSDSNESTSVPSFIPLSNAKENDTNNVERDDSVIVLDEIETLEPLKKEPRVLRPIVIDGSNVAREHGKMDNTFSCRGIKIAIDYFLEKGHERVTAFVPLYRRHNKFGPVLTTDQFLLEELAKQQHVVFTPSRRLNNRRVTCYDDRFIVDLATSTGGVILSNDNYRDLVGESEGYKKTIEERLLMFCFVGDILMIPSDPLGKNGPRLDEFLSMSATEKSLLPISSQSQ